MVSPYIGGLPLLATTGSSLAALDRYRRLRRPRSSALSASVEGQGSGSFYVVFYCETTVATRKYTAV